MTDSSRSRFRIVRVDLAPSTSTLSAPGSNFFERCDRTIERERIVVRSAEDGLELGYELRLQRIHFGGRSVDGVCDERDWQKCRDDEQRRWLESESQKARDWQEKQNRANRRVQIFHTIFLAAVTILLAYLGYHVK
jgi:hypothetical protein